MPYQDEELIKQKRTSSRQAITLAMEGRWKEAVIINQEIIKDFSGDLEAFNRLGRAHTELGQYKQAWQAYHKALELDPYNAIAERNLKRLEYLKEKDDEYRAASPQKIEPHVFIEEIGKAAVVELEKLAPKEALATVDAGDQLKISIKGLDLAVENEEGIYLGKTNPVTSRHLIKLIEGGNRYSANAISATEGKLSIILREVFQHPSQVGHLSFPVRGSLMLKPYSSEAELKIEESKFHRGGDGDMAVENEESTELEEDSDDEEIGV